MKRLLGIIVVVAVLGAAAWGALWYTNRASAAPTFQSAEVKRGELLAVISATGTVEPQEVVDVGAQVAGQIVKFGTDADGKTVDYNSVVKEKMLLAQIDDSLYKADRDSAKAALESAKANIQKAEADLLQMKAKLGQAQADWERAQKIGPSEALAQSTYDQYKFAFEIAKANVAVADASLAQAKNGEPQAEATLTRAQRNVDYCTIRAPVDGTVISRRVNIGQTVVSSLNAPSLFLIAKDLTKVEVWAPVNEADIGSIQPGQDVTFTVESEPGRTFHGTVDRVRLDATMTQNVVTYTVEVTADNSDGKLRPYLTAAVQFQVAKKNNVLMVPNAALRWSPASPDMISPEAQEQEAAGQTGQGGQGGRGGRAGGGEASPAGPTTAPSADGAATPGGRGRGGRGRGGRSDASAHRGTVWVQDGKYVKPIQVRTGLTDGVNTEVTSSDLKEGTQVVTAEIRADAGGSDEARNPFAPQFRGGRGGRGGGGGGGGGGGRGR